MKRKISETLLQWKNNTARMPLIVNGARQVGKTYIIEQFGKEHFENTLYLNMEIEASLRTFLDKEMSPAKIIQFIEATKKQKITVGKTLLFFDEIQACERALTSLKYFSEQMPQLHVVAAGSLLGVAVNREKYSFPVGKVNELNLFPLDFEEFLWAVNHTQLAEEIKHILQTMRQCPMPYTMWRWTYTNNILLWVACLLRYQNLLKVIVI